MADAQIFVDPRSIQALDTNPSQPDANAEVLFVESQAQIISSESVLSRVVAANRLADDPEFAGAASQGGGLFAHFGLRSDPAPADFSLAERNALTALADRVTVRRPERTFVLDVAVRTRTAEKAARLANAVAQAYFDEQSDAHSRMARRANKSLTDRLDELRERVRNSEERAGAFRRDHGLVGTRTQLVSEQQLTDANTQLAQVRSRVIAAQSRIDEIRRAGTPDAMPGTSPEALLSPTITLLRGQQSDARRRLDKALGQLGPLHPEVRDARAEVEGLNHAITAELARIAQAARIELQRATTTEAAPAQDRRSIVGPGLQCQHRLRSARRDRARRRRQQEPPQHLSQPGAGDERARTDESQHGTADLHRLAPQRPHVPAARLGLCGLRPPARSCLRLRPRRAARRRIPRRPRRCCA